MGKSRNPTGGLVIVTVPLHGALIHSLKHTMLTRLGEAGADAFTIMRIAGHGSVTTSQRYVHPTQEGMGTGV